jgi:hypothetical protein
VAASRGFAPASCRHGRNGTDQIFIVTTSDCVLFWFCFSVVENNKKRTKTKITIRSKHYEIKQPHSPSLQKSTYPPPAEITAESNLLALKDFMVFLPPFFFLAKKADADSAMLL